MGEGGVCHLLYLIWGGFTLGSKTKETPKSSMVKRKIVEPICLDLINQSWGPKGRSIKGCFELQVSGLGPYYKPTLRCMFDVHISMYAIT